MPAGRLAGRRVVLGVSGGVAAYKSASFARLLMGEGAEVRVIMTEAATVPGPADHGRPHGTPRGHGAVRRRAVGQPAHGSRRDGRI